LKLQSATETGDAKNLLGKRLFTLKEAAQYLGRSEWGMRDLIWAGKIPVVREEGGRKIFIDVQDLVAYVERNKAVYH
jgi:excisionase family DNA binding protein